MTKACDSSVHSVVRRGGGDWLRHVGGCAASTLCLYGLMLQLLLLLHSTRINYNDGGVLFVHAFRSITTTTTLSVPSRTSQSFQHKVSPIISFGITEEESNTPWILSAKATGDDDGDDDNDNGQQQQDRTTEIEELQKELDAITAPPPKNIDDPLTTPAMIGSFDADSFDETKIPVPLFTGVIVLILSTAVTFELYNIGLNGFPTS